MVKNKELQTPKRKWPMAFGSVNIGVSTARVGFTIDRAETPLPTFDEYFGNRRLVGSIQLLPGGTDPDQQSFEGMSESIVVEGSFDVKTFSVRPKAISAGMSFATSEIDVSDLAKFAKTNGYLVVENVELIPEPKKDKESEPIEQSTFACMSDDDDRWRLAPIDELNLPKGITATLKSVAVTTLGELEDVRSGKDKRYYHGLKEVPKIGQAAIDKIETQVIAWLSKNRDSWGEESTGEEATTGPAFVMLTRNIKGFANNSAGMYEGATFEVDRWEDDCPWVKSNEGDDVRLQDRDWKSATGS